MKFKVWDKEQKIFLISKFYLNQDGELYFITDDGFYSAADCSEPVFSTGKAKEFELMQVIIHKQTGERRYVTGINHDYLGGEHQLTYTSTMARNCQAKLLITGSL